MACRGLFDIVLGVTVGGVIPENVANILARAVWDLAVEHEPIDVAMQEALSFDRESSVHCPMVVAAKYGDQIQWSQYISTYKSTCPYGVPMPKCPACDVVLSVKSSTDSKPRLHCIPCHRSFNVKEPAGAKLLQKNGFVYKVPYPYDEQLVLM